MYQVAERVHNKTKGSKVGNEGDDNSVKESLFGQNIGEFGVKQHEANSHGEIHPCLEKGYDLSRASFRRHYQDVLGVSEDRVVEENAEEH